MIRAVPHAAPHAVPHAAPSARTADRHGPRRAQVAARAVSAVLLAMTPALVQAQRLPAESHAQPYPAAWPSLSGMSPSCAEIAGRYRDPMDSDRGGAVPRDGIRYGAWAALGFASNTVGANDPLFTTRQVEFKVRADGALAVRYVLDGAEVATRSFPGSAVACRPDGLALTAFDRRQILPPKVAIRGPDTVRSVFYRVGGYLYVKTIATTWSRVLYVVPLSSTVVTWQRFAVDAD